jgi:hypothetical protein
MGQMPVGFRKIPAMDGKKGPNATRSTVYRPGVLILAVTLAACVLAIIFRTPLRARFWAWQIIHANRVEDRAAPLTLLCNTGDPGWWGTEALLTHSNAEIRQFGIVVLQHVPSDWARRRLLEMLADPSAAVAELAALGLAIHGDASAIPELERLFRAGDAGTVSAVAVALERLGGPEAVAALAELATEPADAGRRAALVDALTATSCTGPLLEFLNDHRSCDVPLRADRLVERFLPLAAEHGLIPAPADEPTSRPSSNSRPRTVAERAAAGLARITGLDPPFASTLPADQRAHAEQVWRQWLSRQP